MKTYLKLILLLAVPLLLFVAYSWWGGDWGMRKMDFSVLREIVAMEEAADEIEEERAEADSAATVAVVDSVQVMADSVVMDTAGQRILFFGDSMLEGLMRRLSDYGVENGHELTSVIWYSSTSQHWAESDTLEYFMRKVNPTYLVVCLCSNELFARDLDDRDRWLKKVVEKMGDVPFVWISPPNWTEDTGINDLIIKNVGERRYFDSRNLTLQRGRDKIHPTFKAAEGWMDSVAVWITDKSAHPIRMEKPQRKYNRNSKLYILTSS